MDGSQQYVYTIMYNIWLKLHIIWVIQFHGVSYGPIQSHYIYRSRAVSHSYGTEYEIWSDFGPVGITEKEN